MLFIKCLNSLQQELAWHSIFLGVHQAQIWGLRGQLGQLFVEALKLIVSALGTRVEGGLVWARCQTQKRGLISCMTAVGANLQAVTAVRTRDPETMNNLDLELN